MKREKLLGGLNERVGFVKGVVKAGQESVGPGGKHSARIEQVKEGFGSMVAKAKAIKLDSLLGSAPTQAQKLPPGWGWARDDAGALYFFNRSSGIVTYDHPGVYTPDVTPDTPDVPPPPPELPPDTAGDVTAPHGGSGRSSHESDHPTPEADHAPFLPPDPSLLGLADGAPPRAPSQPSTLGDPFLMQAPHRDPAIAPPAAQQDAHPEMLASVASGPVAPMAGEDGLAPAVPEAMLIDMSS